MGIGGLRLKIGGWRNVWIICATGKACWGIGVRLTGQMMSHILQPLLSLPLCLFHLYELSFSFSNFHVEFPSVRIKEKFSSHTIFFMHKDGVFYSLVLILWKQISPVFSFRGIHLNESKMHESVSSVCLFCNSVNHVQKDK
jgi:hypothetical protein